MREFVVELDEFVEDGQEFVAKVARDISTSKFKIEAFKDDEPVLYAFGDGSMVRKSVSVSFETEIDARMASNYMPVREAIEFIKREVRDQLRKSNG